MKWFNLVVVSLGFLAGQLVLADQEAVKACIQKINQTFMLDTLADKEFSLQGTHTSVKGKTADCSLKIRMAPDGSEGVDLILEAFEKVDDKQVLISRGTASISAGSVLSEVTAINQCDFDENISIRFEVTQNLGWLKTFKQKMRMKRNEQGQITKAAVDFDGPYNTAGGIECSF